MSLTQNAKTLIKLSNVYARLVKQQDQWLVAHGLSYREFLIMCFLQNAPTRNLKRIDLAEQAGLSASGVTRLLNPMEKIGLITKEEGVRDARVSLVRLTAAGEAVLQDAEKSFNQGVKAFFTGLDSEQRDALATLADIRLH